MINILLTIFIFSVILFYIVIETVDLVKLKLRLFVLLSSTIVLSLIGLLLIKLFL